MGCSRGVPGLFRAVPGCSGLFRAVPGVFWGCSGVFRGCSGVFRGVPGCSGFYRHPFNGGYQKLLSITSSRQISQNISFPLQARYKLLARYKLAR